MRPHFDRRTTLLFLIPALFGFLGVCLLTPALWFGYQSWEFLRIAESAPGAVAALDWSDDSDTSGARPIVEFEIRGEPYRISGSAWSYPPAYAVGDHVQVLYPPEQPRAARIYSWFDFWFLPVLLGGIGLVFGLVGLGVGYAIWRSLSGTLS
jgi:hypothetical protein